MKKVIGIGAGGHARVVIDILQQTGGCEIVGLLERDPQLWNSLVLGVLVIGNDSLLAELHDGGISRAFVGIGSSGNTRPRREAFEMLRRIGLHSVSAIHPAAVVSPHAELGIGVTVMARAVINPGAVLGDNVVVNTGAIVEHDCVLEDHVYIATAASLSGSVFVGEGSHIGNGATVKQGVRIGRGAIVGAGAAVIRDVPDGETVVGVPAKPIRTAVAHG
jgi:UDP-perosamine 4-acetyltransferase